MTEYCEDQIGTSWAMMRPMPTLATMWVYLTRGEDELMKSVQQCITVYDAGDGEFLRRIDGLPPGYLSMVEPW